MSVDSFSFDEYAGSGRGLLARPVLPNNVNCVQSHVASIDYKVIKKSDSSFVTGTLDPEDVMLTAPSGKNTWPKDQIGYTFNWAMPGTLIPDPNETYQIVITFTLVPALDGNKFIRIWKATTFDPEG